MAMRVYELAKKLGMENRVLIPELKKMGVSVTSHSSALDDEIVEKVLGKLAPQSKGRELRLKQTLHPSSVPARRRAGLWRARGNRRKSLPSQTSGAF